MVNAERLFKSQWCYDNQALYSTISVIKLWYRNNILRVTKKNTKTYDIKWFYSNSTLKFVSLLHECHLLYFSLTFSHDSQRLYMSSSDGTVSVWESPPLGKQRPHNFIIYLWDPCPIGRIAFNVFPWFSAAVYVIFRRYSVCVGIATTW